MPSPTDAFSGMVTRRVGLEPTPTIFCSTTRRMRLVNSMSFARTASPTDAFSGMVTKKGRFGTDPYDIFLNHGTSAPRKLGVLRKDVIPYKYIKHFSINLRIIGRIEPTNPELLDISDTNPKNPRRFSNTLHLSVSKNPFIMIKSNEK